MAARRKLYVSPDGQRWKVQEGGAAESYHPTQTAAISRAKTIVRSLPPDEISQILIQRPDERSGPTGGTRTRRPANWPVL